MINHPSPEEKARRKASRVEEVQLGKRLKLFRAELVRIQPTVTKEWLPRMDTRIDEAMAAFARHDGAAAWQALDACAGEWDDGPAGRVLEEMRPETAGDNDRLKTGKRTILMPVNVARDVDVNSQGCSCDAPAQSALKDGSSVELIEVERLGLCRVTRSDPWGRENSKVWELIFELLRRYQAKGFLQSMYPLPKDTQPEVKLDADDVATLLREMQDWELLDRLSARRESRILGYLLRSYENRRRMPMDPTKELELVAARIEKHWPAGENRASLQHELASNRGTADLDCDSCDEKRLMERYSFGAAYEAVMLRLMRDAPIDDWQRVAAKQLSYGVVRWEGTKVMHGRWESSRFDCRQAKFQRRLTAVLNTRTWPQTKVPVNMQKTEDEESNVDGKRPPDRETMRERLLEDACTENS